MTELDSWFQEVSVSPEFQQAADRARKFYDTYTIFNEQFQLYLKMKKPVYQVSTTNSTDGLLNPPYRIG